MSFLRDFDRLDDTMRTEQVKEYYDCIRDKSATYYTLRFFDLFIVLCIFLLTLPLFLLSALLIKITSRGPILFKQERIARYNKPFFIYKFRSMCSDSHKKGGEITVGEDTRITKVGKVLRKLNLDELPQLLNVLRGDMSIVGTRPEVKRYVELYTPEMYATLLLPQGMVSTASIEYRHEAEVLARAEDPEQAYVQQVLPDKMRYNLDYIKDYSVKSYFMTLYKTVACIFKRDEKLNGAK